MPDHRTRSSGKPKPVLIIGEPPTSGDQIANGGTSRGIAGTRSQTGHYGPGCVTVEPGENGWMPLDAHKPNTLSACSWVIFFRSPRDCHPARGLSFLFREGDHRRKAVMSNPVAKMLHEIAQRLIQIVPSRTLRAYTTPISIMMVTAMGVAKAMIFGI